MNGIKCSYKRHRVINSLKKRKTKRLKQTLNFNKQLRTNLTLRKTKCLVLINSSKEKENLKN